MSHAEFLREFTSTDPFPFVRSIWSLARTHAHLPPQDAAQAIIASLDETLLPDPRDAAVVSFVTRLTLTPGLVTQRDHVPLRSVGLDDRGILDIVQVTACFAFMNRLADGTGVTVEPYRHELARTLFGPEALREHLAWGAPTAGVQP